MALTAQTVVAIEVHAGGPLIPFRGKRHGSPLLVVQSAESRPRLPFVLRTP